MKLSDQLPSTQQIIEEKERDSSQSSLHNMSAPPQMVIEMHPLSEPDDTPAFNRMPRIWKVVDIRSLFDHYVGTPYHLTEQNIQMKALMLAELVAYGEIRSDTLRPNVENLYDRFATTVSNIENEGISLPHFALVTPDQNDQLNSKLEKYNETNLTMSLLLISHISGSLFINSRTKHLPSNHLLNRPILFYLPEGGSNEVY